MKAVSLLYHDGIEPNRSDASGFALPGADRYKLPFAELESHFAAIAAHAIRPPSTVDVFPRGSGDTAPLFITFDDGGSSATRIAAMLETFGWRGHFFVATDYVGSPGFLEPRDIRDLAARGHVIGSHSHTHPPSMFTLGPEQLAREWTRSLDVLGSIIARRVTAASVPFGSYSSRVAAAASAAGIVHLFTSEPLQSCRVVADCTVFGRYAIKRGDTASTVRSLIGPRWTMSKITRLAAWKVRKAARRVLGPLYATLRDRAVISD